MTDNELVEIERIWELEASRNPTFRDFREVNSPGIRMSGMKGFFEKVLKDHESVILLTNDDSIISSIRNKLTEDTATKKLRFSDCVLLFDPSLGLILRQI